MPSAAIIGAGHNGLVAAFYLARAGVDVTVLELRDSVGGLCATEEIFPGIRGNFCANSAHNLEPKVLEDMQLEHHGLRWSEPLEPNSFIMFPGGRRIVSWPDERDLAAEYDQFGHGEYARHKQTLEEMSDLGRALDVSFFEAPPSFGQLATKPLTWQQQEVFRRVMFGSAAEVVGRYLKSEEAQTSLGMLAAAGNFIGPATPGSGYQLMQRALYRGAKVMRDRPKVKATADFNSRAALGGMGAITAAMASAVEAAGGTIRTGASVSRILTTSGRASGVVLASGEEVAADVVVSAVNPKLTMLDMVESADIPADARAVYEALEMTGCMGKVYLELDALPIFDCARSPEENNLLVRCGFRIGDSVNEMQRAYELARQGDWRGSPIIYGLTQTSFDPTLTDTGRHLMSLSVAYAPYDVVGGWEQNRDEWGKHVIDTLRGYVRNLDDILRDHRVLTTADLEQEFGLLEGNALHGDVTVPHMFDWRPIPGYSDYTTPVESLYLCSNGTWPANYVSGLPGHNAAHRIIADLISSA